MSTPRHAPRVPFAILVTGLIVGGLVLLLVLNTFSAANELRRHDLASRDASIGARLQELQNEVADSAAPANLAAAAVALGMVPAGNPAFLVIGRDRTVRVMGSAAAATPAVVDLPNPPAAPKSSSAAEKNKHGQSKTSGKKKAKHGKTSDNKNNKKQNGATKNKKSNNGNKKTDKQTGQHTTPTPTPTPTPTLTLPGGDR